MSMEVINGFVCKNCTDVDYAKRFVDPAHPEEGPVTQQKPTDELTRGPAVQFGGNLAGGNLAGGEAGGSQADRDRALFRPYGPDARA